MIQVNNSLERAITVYCKANGIDDIDTFANNCMRQGFNIVKYGISPKDNIEREDKGIVDVNTFNSYEPTREEKIEREHEESSELCGEQMLGRQEGNKRRAIEDTQVKEVKKAVRVRKVKVIKKDG